jgi:hypothetical protein
MSKIIDLIDRQTSVIMYLKYCGICGLVAQQFTI